MDTEGFTVDTANIGAAMDQLKPEQKAQLYSAAFATAAAGFGAISSLLQAKSQQVIRGIDQEIEAEKKRDGKSKESLARIKALEARKEKEKEKL